MNQKNSDLISTFLLVAIIIAVAAGSVFITSLVISPHQSESLSTVTITEPVLTLTKSVTVQEIITSYENASSGELSVNSTDNNLANVNPCVLSIAGKQGRLPSQINNTLSLNFTTCLLGTAYYIDKFSYGFRISKDFTLSGSVVSIYPVTMDIFEGGAVSIVFQNNASSTNTNISLAGIYLSGLSIIPFVSYNEYLISIGNRASENNSVTITMQFTLVQ